MKPRKAFVAAIAFLLVASLVQVVNAAPSGSIYFDPSGQVTSADNVLEVTGSKSTEQFTVTFKNTASADITDVASTIQYITLAAANTNPARVVINPLLASWRIFLPGGTPRTSIDSVTGSVDTSATYAPYSTTDTVYLYTWALGPPSGTLDAYTDTGQFTNDLRILRPGEFLNLTITIQCQGLVGDSRIWFFFRATEAAYASGSYPTSITAIDAQYRVNLYYSKLPGPAQTKYWLPLHNSYDPYDSDIGTGHNFDQTSWTRGPTTNAFAKANKLVHNKPVENPPPAVSCIHIVKTGPTAAQRGQTITYDYAVTNCGTVALTVAKTGGVTDTLGMTVSYVSGDTNNDGKLDTTETWLFTSTYTVKENDPDLLVNTATVTGTPPEGDPVQDTSNFSVEIVAGQGVFSFHICGTKFVDLNGDGRYDPASEPGTDGVTVVLLGPDRMTKATAYYTEFSYPPPEDATPDVLQTGENMLHGSYCFNLVVGEVAAGETYTFYIQIEGQLIGPITLVASEDGPRESLNNDFGNAAPAVGGLVLPTDTLEVIAPWMALFGLLGVIIAVVAVGKKGKN